MRFGNLVLISIDFDGFTSPFTPRDSVSSAIQTPRISWKIIRCASYFQLSSPCLDMPMKHCLSCLILLETLKSELNEIYSTKGKEEMFRSKVKWVEEGEKKSKYFFSNYEK